ncbi:MAG TPA: hypothetical protein VNE39_12260 [Planctomycetota bacterium]|nr:hypothetical protein [Planctomycetota bacterium]
MPPIPNAPRMELWLDGIQRFLAPPQEKLEATGSWDSSYVVLNSSSTRVASEPRPAGMLRVRRTPAADGASARLDVELVARGQWFGSFRMAAAIECATDALATPRSWKLSTASLDAQDRPVALTAVEESGRIEDGTVVRTGAKERRTKAPGAVTSNWSLFDAVQRLPREKTPPLDFALLEDLDLLKANQRLTWRGAATVQVGGKPLELFGYQQLGEGILPHHYWLDAAGRLLIVYGGLRCFVFNARAATLPGAGQPAGRRAGK